jgi:signal transduction histidine kinase
MSTSDVIDQTSGLVVPTVSAHRTFTYWSLRWRLPVLTFALVGSVGAVFAWMAHREVERALRLNGHERIVAAARQVSDLFAQSIAGRTAEINRLALDPGVTAIVRGEQAVQGDAPAALQTVTTRPQPASVWLYDANGRAISHLPAKARTWQTPAQPTSSQAIEEGISPLQVNARQIFYRTTSKVLAQDGSTTAGFITLERTLGAAPASALIERLIGSGAALRLGNTRGDLWSDLSAPAAGPPVAQPGASVSYVNPQGEVRLGAALPLPGTPWLLWAEVSEASLLAPAKTLARRMVPITLAIMAVGALGIYALTRRITVPLEQLATAADGIQAGDYSRRVASRRRDEIGRLGDAFNGMAARIGETHQLLESRVHERTAALKRALDSLHDTQAELVRRERLAMLGQLSSSVGHELRNPLGVMTNAVYYLKMIQADAPQQVGEYLGILQHQIGLAEKIVGDLLDFARLRPPQVQAVAMGQLIDQQLARLGPVDRMVIACEGLDDLPHVEIDPVQIGQVLFNLLTNAHQAMETGGTLTIRGHRSGESVVIAVADTGRGIAPELLDKIFEPLFTTKARGIGLGLAVSRTLTASNGGRLTVASEPGKGATFTLTLPVTQKVTV